MKWIFENFQIVVAVVAAVVYFLTRGKRAEDDPDGPVPPQMADAERERAERTRRIQEEIRRKIVERRGGTGEDMTQETSVPAEPPVMRPAEVRPVDPFGGPMRRVVREIEEGLERRRQGEVDSAAQARAAEIERQTRLGEQLRALQVQREAEERKAAEITAMRIRQAAAMLPAKATASRPWLKEPSELRRAIVMREVLGPPVALR